MIVRKYQLVRGDNKDIPIGKISTIYDYRGNGGGKIREDKLKTTSISATTCHDTLVLKKLSQNVFFCQSVYYWLQLNLLDHIVYSRYFCLKLTPETVRRPIKGSFSLLIPL